MAVIKGGKHSSAASSEIDPCMEARSGAAAEEEALCIYKSLDQGPKVCLNPLQQYGGKMKTVSYSVKDVLSISPPYTTCLHFLTANACLYVCVLMNN